MSSKLIRIKDDTYSRLCKKAKYGQCMDDVIKELLDKQMPKSKNNKKEINKRKRSNINIIFI